MFKIFNKVNDRICLIKYSCIPNTSVIAVFKEHLSICCCCCCCVSSVVSNSVRPHRRQPTRLHCSFLLINSIVIFIDI